jgi:hypothetical protein
MFGQPCELHLQVRGDVLDEPGAAAAAEAAAERAPLQAELAAVRARCVWSYRDHSERA